VTLSRRCLVFTDLVDDEQLLYALFTRDLAPGTQCAAELDVDSFDDLPLVTFVTTAGDQNANGPGLWSVSLTVNVFADGQDAAWAVCKTVYGVIHAWATPGGGVLAGLPELGHISRVEDVSKFSRTATVDLGGKNITQYAGLFTLSIRN
jgi:hypothetical protein